MKKNIESDKEYRRDVEGTEIIISSLNIESNMNPKKTTPLTKTRNKYVM